ncbi:MAG: hypothetical protein A2W91_07255 [Bacteroidetes bacterium GWF2_38_335]|nr:MAG: hypothetical protein A2W91_07255 [Bacteroidetes bacterium GWF2_38_335]OFY77125.1 MAG: hypothetical protein A2281_14490 [Bacteroidetes bacterium RIFOXYA12_FULL_38_20]HBS85016.1 hypothetical protein [Bacteroidales bacterium]
MKKIIQLLSTPLPGIIRKPIYRLMGAKIGNRVKLSSFAVVVSKEIDIRDGVKISGFTFIYGIRSLKMGTYSHISRLCYITGYQDLKIGARSGVGFGCHIEMHLEGVEIGNYSGFSPKCVVNTHGIYLPYTHGYNPIIAKVKLGDFSLVQARCYIGPGVIVPDETIIVAGSNVLQRIDKPGVIVDSGFKRERFPLGIMKRKVDKESHYSDIKKLTLSLLNYFSKNNLISQYEEFGNSFYFFCKKKKVKIVFDERIQNEHSEYVWIFNSFYSKEIQRNETEFNFIKLTFDGHTGIMEKKALKYFQTYFGLRFIPKSGFDEKELIYPKLES